MLRSGKNFKKFMNLNDIMNKLNEILDNTQKLQTKLQTIHD